MQAQTMRRLRQFHFYVGIFFTPAILFFAFSGALQTFSLHEAKGYGGASPPGWIAWMASVHKDQTLPHKDQTLPHEEPAPAAKPVADHDHADDHADDHDHGPAGDHGAAGDHAHADDHDHAPAGVSPLPLKIFVVLVGIGLIASSLLGVGIALNSRAMRRNAIVMLIAGSLLPVALLFL